MKKILFLFIMLLFTGNVIFSMSEELVQVLEMSLGLHDKNKNENMILQGHLALEILEKETLASSLRRRGFVEVALGCSLAAGAVLCNQNGYHFEAAGLSLVGSTLFLISLYDNAQSMRYSFRVSKCLNELEASIMDEIVPSK
ncbi:MAG: hypothetical protein WD055_03420 [Candidatus Dependentiae bacterium]